MHHIVLPIALVLMGVTDPPATPVQAFANEPRSAMLELHPNLFSGRNCRNSNLPAGDNPDRQPRPERGPASPGMGQFIYAVDRRVDGCSVVVIKSSRLVPWQGMQLTPEEMAKIKDGRASSR